VGLVAVVPVLAPELQHLQRPLHAELRHLQAARVLLEKILGALLDSRHGRLDAAVSGEQDDRGLGAHALQALQDLQAVAVGELQVKEDHLGLLRLGRLDRAGTAVRLAGAVALALQEVPEALPDGRLVVNDQDGGWHGTRAAAVYPAGERGSATVTVVPTCSVLWMPMAPP